MSEQITFPGFDLSSGFNCDICRDKGWHTPTDYEPYACLCEFGRSITCPECGIIYVRDDVYGCTCCGDTDLDLTPEQEQAILAADEYWYELCDDEDK